MYIFLSPVLEWAAHKYPTFQLNPSVRKMILSYYKVDFNASMIKAPC